jgi:hypothetical protein
MAITLRPLSEIKDAIESKHELNLDVATLGQGCADLFAKLFNEPTEFHLTGCHVQPDGTDRLRVSGAFQRPLSLGNVNVEFILFDLPSLGETRKRHGVFGVSILDIPAVVSSLDYSTAAPDVFYPDFGPGFPRAQIREGINFSVDVPALGRLAPMRQGRIREVAHVSDPNHRVSYLEFGGDVGATPIGFSSLVSLDKIGVALPLSPNDPVGPQIFLTGVITLGGQNLKVKAELDPHQHELRLSIQDDDRENLPTLMKVIDVFGSADNSAKSLKNTYFPDALSTVLDVKLRKLSVFVNLAEKTISEVEFELATNNKIKLIPEILEVTARLEVQIYAPFDAHSRSVEGVLEGAWDFGRTELSFPSLDFSVAIKPVSFGSLLEKLTKEKAESLGFPATVRDITLNEMALTGNFREKRFSAEIELGTNWKFEAAGREFALTGITMTLAYGNGALAHLGMSACLNLAEVEVFVFVSGEWNTGGGWTFAGSTRKTVKIDDFINKLFPNTSVSPMLKDFTADTLQISFNTHSKDFTFTFDGKLTKEISATVTVHRTHQHDGVSPSTHFSGQMTLGDGAEFDLIFDKAEEGTRALASYHDTDGLSLTIKDLVRPVFPILADKIPPGLKFTSHDALLGYSDSKWLFGVDIEGGLNLSDVKLPDFPLLSRFAPSPDQTLKLAVQVVDATGTVEVKEVDALAALNPGGLKLPRRRIDGLALAASLRLGQESRQLSLPIGVKTNSSAKGNGSAKENGLVDSSGQTSDVTVDNTPHSSAQAVGADEVQWVTIQKSFGPIHFERVGIAYANGEITGLLDAALSVGGLTIALDGLSVTSKLTKFEPTFSLRGLGIDYHNGPLEIGGAFLERTITDIEGTHTEFAGEAVLRTEQLSLSAIGSYALKDGHPSLFVYAVLDYPLGGPAFFFVTGLAAGFGYNRSLTIPTLEQVQSFPLVTQALPGRQTQPLTKRLEELEGYLPRAVGEHFLAVGLHFTSFKKIDSFALLTVKFGKELEFDLLGLSTLDQPEVARAQLALKATFKPHDGILAVRAQLAPDSYVLSQRCHLMGGAAFYSWFKDHPREKPQISGGDFVLTLGGYHPGYTPPAHYPHVPRLGFNWQVDEHLQLKGDAYYAMTPHALMAGGHLEATWQKDQLRAWFRAAMDFLINWQPYHYEAHVYVELGASYTYNFFGSHTVTADVGADLHLWGPELSGTATIHWWIIAVTVGFGKEAPAGIKPIDWKDFKTEFLPPDPEKKPEQICGIAVQQGLIRQMDKDKRWILNPKDFVLVTNSVIPSSEARKGPTRSETQGTPIDVQATAPAVRPMGLKQIQSTHTITITKNGSNDPVQVDYIPVYKAVPAALWGKPDFDAERKDFLRPLKVEDVNDHKKGLVENTLAGFEIRPHRAQPEKTPPFEPRLYATELVPDAFAWEDGKAPQAADTHILKGRKAWDAAKGEIDARILQTRNAVLQALGLANIAA